MYSSFMNQFFNMTHYFFSFLLIFAVWPLFIFERTGDSALESFFAGLIKMVLLIIVMGYILVLTQLFELLSIIPILLALSIRRYIRNNSISGISELFDNANIKLYRVLDGIVHPRQILNNQLNKIKEQSFALARRIISNIGTVALFVTVFACSIYIRFHDAVIHAAPALSDAYTTLSWMKHIDARVLFFHDGGEIYPRGFHIFLAVLNKFAAIDPLYTLRYSGPFASILIILGLYFTVSRISESKISGIIAAAVYGAGTAYLPVSLERQASANSQEFAFIFIMPVIYFFFKYIKTSRKDCFITASAGLAVIGLVHQLAFFYVAIEIGILVITAVITEFKPVLRKVPFILASGIAAAVISLTPIAVGRIMGFESHGSSVDFLFSRAMIDMPGLKDIVSIDKIMLLLIFLIALYLIFSKKDGKELLAEKFAMFLGMAVFVFYFYGGALTQSTMISSRSGELWAMVVPVLSGMGWHVLEQLLPSLCIKKAVSFVFCIMASLYILFYLKPAPIAPYKMHSDSSIKQYLRISNMFRPKSWWMVSSNYDDFAIVLGKGFLVHTDEFIEDYNPEGKLLSKYAEEEPAEDLPDNIFIFYEKNIFKVSETNSIYPIEKPKYERREKEKIVLYEWLEKYKKTHENITVFYEDNDLKVYRIYISRTAESRLKKIWGENAITGGAI